jgi:hypothetical protein
MTFGDEQAPDAIEPIMAYRVWLAGDDGRLSSPNVHEVPWPADTWTHARCRQGQHPAPAEGCTCGLYALKELDELPLLVGQLSSHHWALTPDGPGNRLIPLAPGGMMLVAGRVQLVGRVIEHEAGYRAERARLVEIFPLPGGRFTDAIASRYGVPVGDPVPVEPLQSAIEFWMPLLELMERFNPHAPSPPAETTPSLPPSPWWRLGYMAGSLLLLVLAINGIFADQGPHWSGWWLWFVAPALAVVAVGLVPSVWRLIDQLPIGQMGPPTSNDGRLPGPIDRPRPY